MEANAETRCNEKPDNTWPLPLARSAGLCPMRHGRSGRMRETIAVLGFIVLVAVVDVVALVTWTVAQL